MTCVKPAAMAQMGLLGPGQLYRSHWAGLGTACDSQVFQHVEMRAPESQRQSLQVVLMLSGLIVVQSLFVGTGLPGNRQSAGEGHQRKDVDGREAGNGAVFGDVDGARQQVERGRDELGRLSAGISTRRRGIRRLHSGPRRQAW